MTESSEFERGWSGVRGVAFAVLVGLAFGWTGTGRARAEDSQRWLLVPAFSSPRPTEASLPDVTGALEQALRRGTGGTVVSNTDAAMMFETRHSSEPVDLSAVRVEQLMRGIDDGQEHLAMGMRKQSQRDLAEVQSLSDSERDYLRRDPERARKMFDTCLMTAHLLQLDHKQAEANQHVTECAEAFPGFELKPRGPPRLRQLLVEVQRQLQQTPQGALTVASSGQDCAVRLDGVELGKTPITIRAARLRPRRLQLECVRDVPGRIHAVKLTASDSRIVLDPTFDAVVHSHGALSLAYRDDRERAARALDDADAIGKVLGLQRVVVLYIDGSRVPVQVRLEAAFGARQEVATLSYRGPLGYGPAAVEAAIHVLSASAASSRPSARVASSAPEESMPAQLSLESNESDFGREPRDPSLQSQQHVLPGVLLAVGGVAGLVVSWAVYADRQAFRKEPGPQRGVGIDFSTLESFRTRGNWVLASASLGAMLLAVSDYHWLPDERSVPLWAWLAGAAGVAVASIGVGLAIAGTHCQPQELDSACAALSADSTFGPLLALHALPLLALPLSYVLRGWVRPSRVEISVTAQDGRLSVWGVF